MTDTPAHTPGPWESQPLETGDDAGVSIIGSDLGGLVCASLPWPSEIDSGDYSRVESNAAFIVRACNSHYQLVGALGEARRIITEIDDYMMRPERGDWGTECALCMGELLDDDRDALARIDTALSQAGGAGE